MVPTLERMFLVLALTGCASSELTSASGGDSAQQPGGDRPPSNGMPPGAGGDAPPAGSPDAGPDGPVPPGVPTADRSASGPTGLRLLTPSQFRNSVVDVLGPVAAPAVGQWRSSLAAAQGGVAASVVYDYEAAALAVTAEVFDAPEARAALTGCVPAADAADPCLQSVLTRLGGRAWRRPLTPDELARYAQVAVDAAAITGGDGYAGLRYAVAGLLQSPNFLYRVELGTPVGSEDTNLRRLDGYELASRLSYLVWNTTPDAALLEAAARGDLDSDAGVQVQVERLLASPRARDGVVQLFVDLLDLDALLALQKDAALLPAFTPTIGPAMREEVVRVVADVVLEQRDYRRLFDTTRSFVNAELAALYGIAGAFGPEHVPVELPAGRGGLLTLAGFLAIHSGEASTSPTLRGLEVRRALMCLNVPSPPPDVVTELPEPGPDTPMTKRQQLAQHVSDPTCAGCHQFTDPIGLSLERFDALGGWRENDHGLPIDSSGDLDGQPFADAVELGRHLAVRDDTADCLVRNLYRHATGHIEQFQEAPAIEMLLSAVETSGGDLVAAVAALAQSESFRYATLMPEETP
jgi:hypothetical protein